MSYYEGFNVNHGLLGHVFSAVLMYPENIPSPPPLTHLELEEAAHETDLSPFSVELVAFAGRIMYRYASECRRR